MLEYKVVSCSLVDIRISLISRVLAKYGDVSRSLGLAPVRRMRDFVMGANRVAHRTQPHHAPGLSPGARSAPARRSQRSAAQPRTRGSLTKSDTAVTLRIPDSPRKSEVTALARLILGAQHVSAIISTTSFYFGGDCTRLLLIPVA